MANDFSGLGLSAKVIDAVAASGYTKPTDIQAQAIPHVLQKKDIIGIAQTGTGKTASFVLPMLTLLESGRARARMPRTLILEPTRELAAQVHENFEKYGKNHKLSVALLIGGVSFEDQNKVLDRGADVLIATPGRMLDQFERGRILLTGVDILVIDEADRMLDMGFIPDIENICTKLPANRQTLLFSATMPAPIKRLADKFLSNPKTVEVARPASRNENIEQFLVKTSERGKRDALRALIEAEQVNTAIIFCNRKTTVRELAKVLQRSGYNAGEIQGDMDQSSRTAELERFKNGTINILVASDVAARGLDVKGVSHVFNFDAPWHPDDYVHRIGRTGRAGAKGRAFTLVSPSDDEAIDSIQKLTGYKIPVHGGGAAVADAAPSAPSDAEDKPRRARSERSGRGRGGAKAEKAPARPAAEAKAAPAKAPRSRDDRKPAPAPRRDDQDGPDDGWNGPTPGFLSVGFGS